ncbi:uncharacterized protein PHACADRAFT_248128, partial [Phanerochaete carnosa HHB-10118-sp]
MATSSRTKLAPTDGTLLSIFAILSLFTENVKIRWQGGEALEEPHADTDADSVVSGERSSMRPPVRIRPHRSDSDVSTMHLDYVAKQHHASPDAMSPWARGLGASVSSSGSTVHPVVSRVSSPHFPSRCQPVSQGLSVSGLSSTSNRTTSAAQVRWRPIPRNPKS